MKEKNSASLRDAFEEGEKAPMEKGQTTVFHMELVDLASAAMAEGPLPFEHYSLRS